MKICVNTLTRLSLEEYLRRCDEDFEPVLSSRVDLAAYSEKIALYASTIEAWDESSLAGMIAVYVNDKTRTYAFITHVHVFRKYRGAGLASALLRSVFSLASSSGFQTVRLEVFDSNLVAVEFYKKNRFHVVESNSGKLTMEANVAIL